MKLDGDVKVQKYLSTTFSKIVEEGKKLAAIHPSIVVKVPMMIKETALKP